VKSCSSEGFYYGRLHNIKVVKCCTDYVKDRKWIGSPIPLHEGKLRGRGRMGQKIFVYYNSSRLMGRTLMNTCQGYKEIT
jgi:hypothetical protein